MKALRLEGGDLVVGAGGFETLSGPTKVAQDLRLALGEPMGNDRFHPGFGSVLDTFIGQTQDDDITFQVEQEVLRVTSNYSLVQEDLIRRAVWSNQPARNTDEVFGRVSAIKFTSHPAMISAEIMVETVDGSAFVVETETGA